MKKVAQPILKWAGGKRLLLNQILHFFPKKFNTYYEPFLGGASVLLALQPKKAVVNDLNEELVNVYRTIKDNPLDLIESLKSHAEKHSKEYYYKVRNLDREDGYAGVALCEKAARIVYLNRTCYNGLYRVNSKGYFNTPMGGYKKPRICDAENIE
ncbi:MAG: Dam family site-specific DNA-(adenine-N6)-methyltransferase, partial [Bacilli bacterium]|nr:Dam family site-specific DNA-(adenine-N6)-methyltransferase [Bacilli bacterium]